MIIFIVLPIDQRDFNQLNFHLCGNVYAVASYYLYKLKRNCYSVHLCMTVLNGRYICYFSATNKDRKNRTGQANTTK